MTGPLQRPLGLAVIAPMRAAGLGNQVKNLYNDYVYFWRWATWQTTERVAGPGVTAFISASSYIDGLSMGGLRSHLRTSFDELWVIDLGGDSRGARPEENVFDIRTPVAIAIGIRKDGGSSCSVHYVRVAGNRSEKLEWLREHSADDVSWKDVPGVGLEPFTPRSESAYKAWPLITDIFPWQHSGVEFTRTWPISHDDEVLGERWKRLVGSEADVRPALFHENRDRTVTSSVAALPPDSGFLKPLAELSASSSRPDIIGYAYRSFDRQYILADSRLCNWPRPPLWFVRGSKQIYFTSLLTKILGSGPSMTATALIPDRDHFSGRGGRDVLPLYRDREGKIPNLTNGLLEVLATALGRTVTPDDMACYMYGLTGTSAFGDRFAEEFGEAAGPFRIPITSNAELFDVIAKFGRNLLWWHTWGERFDSQDGHACIPLGVAREVKPVVGVPENFRYTARDEQLIVGTGVISPVGEAIWQFEVSGLKVVSSWLGYRMAVRKGRKSSVLDEVRQNHWDSTDELLGLLSILEYTLQVTPFASALLERVVEGSLIGADLLPIPSDAERSAPRD